VKLVASMIVRNELGRYLELCIEHLLTYCEEIRILDDGSDDGSDEYFALQVAMGRPVWVKQNPGPSFYEYESKARNELLAWTMEGVPDYVLSIDADEFVGNPERLLVSMRSHHAAYRLEMEEVWGADRDGLDIRVDGKWGPRPSPILWAAPSPDKLGTKLWSIPDRKLACGREPFAVRRSGARPARTAVFHFGWANRAERAGRFERYMVHDKGEFHANTHLQSIMWPDELVSTVRNAWPQGLSELSARLADRAGASST
jgi:glycosyltransferase involved in cell wall biosynthesis